MNKNPDTYFTDGCGRCSLGGTPACKVHTWATELKLLRKIILSCGLQEESKWGVPCYTFGKSNIVMLAAFKEYCALSFFKGALLQDAEKLLAKPGEESQSVRMFRFTGSKQLSKIENTIRAYIFEAIELEKAGLKVETKKISEREIPEELQNAFDRNPALKKAFEALSPGRQRAYLLHFTQAKQSATRSSRIEKCTARILSGKGLLD